MRLHREGTKTLLLVAGLGCVLGYGAWWLLPKVAAWPIILVITVVMLLVLWFFRAPNRPLGGDNPHVLAPCDGRVVVVEEVEEAEYFKEKRVQISIFMSPLNVHVNYHPISGTTVYRAYHPGKYLVAWHPKSSTDNERSSVVVAHSAHGPVLVRQVAGALARRICTYPQPDEPVVQGSELGFIKFGSRVDLFLPLSAQLRVRIGDKVKGAVTPIADLSPGVDGS